MKQIKTVNRIEVSVGMTATQHSHMEELAEHIEDALQDGEILPDIVEGLYNEFNTSVLETLIKLILVVGKE